MSKLLLSKVREIRRLKPPVHSCPNRLLFFSLLIAYPLAYAPFGINETDGGFITGLAWQIMQGKQLYTEVIYIRPPLTVWLRALELQLLPTDWAILAERVFFYWKVGLAAWLAADCLAFGRNKWVLAALGFVISAHCYPAAAWHTVDGILFGSLGLWLLFQERNSLVFNLLAGISTVGAMLCKQSFFPMAVVFFAVTAFFYSQKKRSMAASLGAVGGFFGAVAAFFFWLKISGAWSAYFYWTAGAGSLGDFFQHGFVDFLRISPKVGGLVAGAVSIGFLVRFLKKEAGFRWPFWSATVGLMASYFFQLLESQSFTLPFAQSRLLFDAGILLLAILFFQKKWDAAATRLAAFLAVSWMASISWGYNLPVLCATPLVFGFWEIGRRVSGGTQSTKERVLTDAMGFVFSKKILLAALIALFWLAQQSIYRDGRRAEMTEPMGQVFPKLAGIYSDRETRDRYLELRQFHEKHGDNLVVVPSFPLADFLLGTRPVLPIDWESSLEVNGRNELIINVLEEKKVVVLVEKNYGGLIQTDPKLAVSKWVMANFELFEERDHFWAYRSGE